MLEGMLGILGMLGQVVGLLGIIAEMNSTLLIVVMFVFMIIAYKVFQYMLRILFTAAIFGAFPFVANYVLGMSIPITLGSVLNYAMLGVTLFFAYASIRTCIRITKFVLRPFKGFFEKKKETVVIREIEREKK